MDNATKIISRYLSNLSWKANYSLAAKSIINELRKYGYIIVFSSKCWCEGKADGSEHTPGCAGIEQERQLRELD